jgi:hypothetical protein
LTRFHAGGLEDFMATSSIPAPLRIVGGIIISTVFGLIFLMWFSGGSRPIYEFAKDALLPLIGPMVGMLVPLLLFYWLPLSQNKQKLAIELFTMYHSEEMRESRNTGWKYFVTERRTLPEKDQDQRLDHFLRYLMEPEVNRKISPELDAIYQKTSRVLDFFAMVDECLENDSVDRRVVRSFMAYYFLWWYDEIVAQLEARPLKPPQNLRFIPVWWNSFRELEKLCRSASTVAESKILAKLP